MLPNATINTWSRITGTTGAGEPVLADLTLAHKVPCEMIQPSAARRASERAAGLEVSRIVTLSHAAMIGGVAGVGEPVVGDRLTIARTRTPNVSEAIDIVEIKEQAGEAGPVWEIKFGLRIEDGGAV